jgi:hypothetical protein
MAVCACGAVPPPRHTQCVRCKWRKASARYRATAHGKQVMTGRNERRIYVGKVYHGRVEDLHRAAVIRAHIQERLREFISAQQNDA